MYVFTCVAMSVYVYTCEYALCQCLLGCKVNVENLLQSLL